MKQALPDAFLRLPIAHRALHDIADGRPENARAAIHAAIAAGYGIEIDLQLTADGHAMVFHDYDMARLTGVTGKIQDRTAEEVAAIPLLHGDGEGVPRFEEVLDLVDGQVPLLVELKHQDPDDGRLEAAAARALAGYKGPVAVMSFNPQSVAEMARLAPDIPRGLTTCAFEGDDWTISDDIRDRLRSIRDFEAVGASFISHHAPDLDRPRVRKLWADGVAILCWTIRSPEEEAEARKLADNVTFEGYMAALAG